MYLLIVSITNITNEFPLYIAVM